MNGIVEELFVPFRGVRASGAQVRSTVIVSAINSVRGRGLGESYERAMSAAERRDLLTLPPALWLPIEVAVEHYRIMDRLGLDLATIESIGAEVGERIYKSVLSTVLKLTKEAGVTPWSVLAIAHRINDLSWKETDIAVWKLGPKEARYEWVNQPCAGVPYFVTSFGSFLGTVIGMFCSKVYVRVMPNRCSPTKLTYRLSWA